MTNQAQAKAARAPQAKAAKAKPVLLTIAPAAMETCAKACAEAFVVHQRANVTLLASVVKAVTALKLKSMSAVQYDRQFRPSFDAALTLRVKRGSLKEASAKVASSRAKSAVLALANGVTPIVGETWGEFLTRASEHLLTAKLPSGEPVWEAQTKRGPKAGKAKRSKAAQSAGDASSQEGGTNVPANLAAALILSGGNRTMAERLVIVATTYRDEFNTWAATILDDAGKAKLAPKAKPETAMAAALAKAEAKAA
jgi:hypothetical protein